MPFISKRQQRWAFANKKPFAKRWAKETPSFAALPEQKDAGVDAGAPLHGPGGLLGMSGMGGKPRKWGKRRIGITTKPMTRSQAARVAALARWGKYTPKPQASSTAAPRTVTPKPARRSRGGRRGHAVAKPKKTEQQRAIEQEQRRQAHQVEHAQQQAKNRAAVDKALGLPEDAVGALDDLRAGKPTDDDGGLVKLGLAEQAADGSYRLTPAGRALDAARAAGDVGRARDIMSSARDRLQARQERQAVAAERKRLAEAARPAKPVKPTKSGGGSGKKKEPKSAQPSATQERARRRRNERTQRRIARMRRRAKRRTQHQQPVPTVPASVRPPAIPPSAPRRPSTPLPRRGVPIDPARGRGTIPTRTKAEASFIVFKDASGVDRWLARSTTAYRDRDREILEIAALDADGQRMTAARQFGPLRWWHIGEPNPLDTAQPWGVGVDVGDCDFSTQIGTTRVESGTFRSPALAQRIAETADEYELSPGFFHPYGLNGPPDGIYRQIRTFERSLVPTRYGRASNLFTGLTVKEFRMDPNEMERRFKAAIEQLRLSPDQAEVLAAGLVQADKSAQAQGIAFKSDDAPQVFTAPDGTPGIIQDGRFVALKAGMAPASMEQAGAIELADAASEELADGVDNEAAEEADYIGDMSVADFEALLARAFQSAIQQFGSDITTHMGALDEAVKGMGYARTKAEQVQQTEIAALKARLAELEGNRPAVTLPAEVEAALKSGGPQAPPAPGQAQIPADAPVLQQIAARTMPQLYTNGPGGQFTGWTPPVQPSQS